MNFGDYLPPPYPPLTILDRRDLSARSSCGLPLVSRELSECLAKWRRRIFESVLARPPVYRSATGSDTVNGCDDNFVGF